MNGQHAKAQALNPSIVVADGREGFMNISWDDLPKCQSPGKLDPPLDCNKEMARRTMNTTHKRKNGVKGSVGATIAPI